MATITHTALASKLLKDAAVFFRTIGEQNPPLKIQMDENANVFEQVAHLLEHDPTGSISEE